MAAKYHFEDPDMDFFFVVALGWGAEVGLSVGQAFYVAAQIVDGDATSWVKAFTDYGELLDLQASNWAARGWHRQSAEVRLQAFASNWAARGWHRQSAEVRLQAFASYRSAWQFASPGTEFEAIYAKERSAFATAIHALSFPVTFVHVPYQGRLLPGMFLTNQRVDAPIVLLIGGADTGFEDTFLTAGRALFERGYSVAMVDLPRQGLTMADGFGWEAAAEQPIAAIIDVLVDRFAAQPGRIALMGCSLGGYFVTRAAGYETRLGAVIASTPFPYLGRLFAEQAATAKGASSTATQRNHDVLFWKAGAANGHDFLEKTADMVADPSRVTVPFLAIVGAGESRVMATQAQEWMASIASQRKDLVLLRADTGADGHVQVNNRRRLVQEVSGWLDEVFGVSY